MQEKYNVEFYTYEGRWHWRVMDIGRDIVIDSERQAGFESSDEAERNFDLVQKAMLTL